MPTKTKPPPAMPWFGGKSPYSGRGVCRWIVEQLPNNTGTYAEPFCGMLGVLRAREPAALEIVNDINGELTNWWEAVRDHSEELAAKLEDTPNSEKLFYDLRDTAPEDVASWSCVDRAWRFTVLVLLSHSTNMVAFQTWLKPDKPAGRKSRIYTFVRNIPALKERIRHIQIRNTTAEHLLEQLAGNENCLIYADPPYPSAAGRTTYQHHKLDIDTLLGLFSQQKGKVAISGYPDDPWNDLGWRHEDLDDYCKLAEKERVTERLWMNYDPLEPEGLLF